MVIIEIEDRLLGCFGNLLPSISDVHTPEPAGAVDQFPTTAIAQPHAAATLHDIWTLVHVGRYRRQRMEDAVPVHVLEAEVGPIDRGSMFQHWIHFTGWIGRP